MNSDLSDVMTIAATNFLDSNLMNKIINENFFYCFLIHLKSKKLVILFYVPSGGPDFIGANLFLLKGIN